MSGAQIAKMVVSCVGLVAIVLAFCWAVGMIGR